MRELYAFVWRSSASQQIILIILAIIAALLATAPLELQRHIINTLAGHEKVERLGWLCGGYLIAALGIGGLKYLVNIKSSGLGESMIRSLREAVLRSFSASAYGDATPDETRKDKSGALVTTISSQAETVGKFVGDCISTPIVQAGTLLSVLSYMLYTEPRGRSREFSWKPGRQGIRDDLCRAPARVPAQIWSQISGQRTAVGGCLRPAVCRRDYGSERKDRN